MFDLGKLLGTGSPEQQQQTQGAMKLAETGPKESKFREFMQRPEVLAYLLSSTPALLAQRGIGNSIGAGVQGIGNFANIRAKEKADKEQADREYELADRRLKIQEQAAARSGSGGGRGGGSSAANLKGPLSVKEIAKYLVKEANDANEFNLDAPQLTELDVWNEATAIAKAQQVTGSFTEARALVEAYKNGGGSVQADQNMPVVNSGPGVVAAPNPTPPTDAIVPVLPNILNPMAQMAPDPTSLLMQQYLGKK